MTLEILPHSLSVCRLTADIPLHFTHDLWFAARTDQEFSLVCVTADVPAQVSAREDGWRAFRVQGVLDFSLTGILAGLSGILADEQIGLFALSTYNTDYLLVRAENLSRAAQAFVAAGHTVL